MPAGELGDAPAELPGGPLSRLMSRASARGLHGADLLRGVAAEIGAEVLSFAAHALSAKQENSDESDQTKHIIALATTLSETLIDALTGFLELRAGNSVRTELCAVAEDFLASASRWTDQWSEQLRKSGRTASCESLTDSWLSLHREIAARIDRCRPVDADDAP